MTFMDLVKRKVITAAIAFVILVAFLLITKPSYLSNPAYRSFLLPILLIPGGIALVIVIVFTIIILLKRERVEQINQKIN